MIIARQRHTRDIAHPMNDIIDSASSSVEGYKCCLHHAVSPYNSSYTY